MDKRSYTLKDTNWLSAVENISKICINERETKNTLQSALDYLINNLKSADVGIIWIYDPSINQLTAHCASGFNHNILKQFRINTDKGLIGRVFQIGKREIYPVDKTSPKTETDSEIIFGTKIPGMDSPSAVACMPLNTGKVKFGLLMLLNLDRKDRFAHKEIIFFQVAANLITLAMENAALKKDITIKGLPGRDENQKTDIISNVAHEMRTPLTSIKGFSTALLMEEIAFKPETQREFLEIIDKECDVLENLISDLLESSTIDSGTVKIDIQPVRLPLLAARAANEVRHRFTKHKLLVDFAHDFPVVDADPERTLQVLRQLLDNAAKYSPEGGLIVLQGKIINDMAVISVADEGVGIAPEDLNRLFDRFFRAKSNSGTQITGTGLGLPICLAIIEAHNGRIWAESQLGQGSIFYFSLPLKGQYQALAD